MNTITVLLSKKVKGYVLTLGTLKDKIVRPNTLLSLELYFLDFKCAFE